MCFIKPLCIGGIYDVYQDVRVIKVIPPVRPDLPLSSNIPNIELEPLRLDGLDIESLCGGDGVDVFAGESLEDRRLAGIVETKQ